jgi:hypothetical protein
MKLFFAHFSYFLSFRREKSRHIWTNKTTKLKWTLNLEIKKNLKNDTSLLSSDGRGPTVRRNLSQSELRLETLLYLHVSCFSSCSSTDEQTDRQTDSVSHRTVPLGFASSYTGPDLGISRLSSTVCLQRWAPRSTVVFRFLSYFLVFHSFFVSCTFCFLFPLYLPNFSSFPFCLYSHIFFIFYFFPSVRVSLLPYSLSILVAIFVCSL